MKKQTAKKLNLKRESLKTLQNLDVIHGGTIFPLSYPRSACPGDTCI